MMLLTLQNQSATITENVTGTVDLTGPSLDWLHIDGDIDAARRWLEDTQLLDAHSMLTLTDELTRPRVFINEQEQLLGTLRAVTRTDNGDFDLVSLRFCATQRWLITTSRQTIPYISEIMAAYTRRHKPETTIDNLLWLLTDRLVVEFTTQMINLEESLSLQEDAWDANQPLEHGALINFRQSLSRLKRYLSPQNNACQRLPQLIDQISDQSHQQAALHKARWREIINRSQRDIESLHEMRERLLILSDIEVKIQQNETNRNMYLLSISASFFLPLTFISSILGMNVAGIPYANHPLAFWGTLVILAVITMIQFWLFSLWRWLGR